MDEIIKFLNENVNGFLATVDRGKPKVRPFQFMFAEKEKLFFCTSNTKDVFKQLIASPYVEFSCTSPSFGWVRVSGKVEFSSDLAVKSKVLEKNELVRSIYKTAANPVFAVFYIGHGTAFLADFSGKPPKVVNF